MLPTDRFIFGHDPLESTSGKATFGRLDAQLTFSLLVGFLVKIHQDIVFVRKKKKNLIVN